MFFFNIWLMYLKVYTPAVFPCLTSGSKCKCWCRPDASGRDGQLVWIYWSSVANRWRWSTFAQRWTWLEAQDLHQVKWSSMDCALEFRKKTQTRVHCRPSSQARSQRIRCEEKWTHGCVLLLKFFFYWFFHLYNLQFHIRKVKYSFQ